MQQADDVRHLRERWRDWKFKVWTWWRASSVTPDPAYMNRQALIMKILWLQDQLDASEKENARLRELLARDDFLLGRPKGWVDTDA